MLHRMLAFVMVVCLAVPAFAEGAKKDSKPEPGTSVEMPFLVAPMSQDGNLLGYVYISSKLICSSSSACISVREKLAFIQDAFVREVNGKPISLPNDPKTADKDQLNARLTAAARRIVGADKVVAMSFMEMKFAPLHPSDSTEMVPPPEQAAATGAGEGGGKADATSAGGGKAASGQGATSKPAAGPSH